jgi:acyl dehydratase
MNAPPKAAISVAELKKKIGQEIGVSQWHLISQEMIDQFADVTGDHQFIHVDPVRAKKETPFGGAIAHGFLTLSLLSHIGSEVMPPIEGRAIGINYGFDKIRFVSPVPAGGKIRGRFRLKEANDRAAKEVMFRYEVTIEIEGVEKPALVAEWLSMAVLA